MLAYKSCDVAVNTNVTKLLFSEGVELRNSALLFCPVADFADDSHVILQKFGFFDLRIFGDTQSSNSKAK